jgi:hypothetical protein
MKFIKSCLIIVLLAVMSSCGKEEVVLTGKLKVTYVNHPAVYYVYISPAENTLVQLTGSMTFDNKGEINYELNAGNYVLDGYGANSTGSFSKGFQIKAGETTQISLD